MRLSNRQTKMLLGLARQNLRRPANFGVLCELEDKGLAKLTRVAIGTIVIEEWSITDAGRVAIGLPPLAPAKEGPHAPRLSGHSQPDR
jgi:hypothetical protein